MLTRGIPPKLTYNTAPSFGHHTKNWEKDTKGRSTAGTTTFN